MKNIGIDIDGVLADFNRAFAGLLGYRPMYAHPDRWDWPPLVAQQDRIDMEWRRLSEHPAWWETIEAYTEAKARKYDIENLSSIANLYFITSRPQVPDMKMYTECWLSREIGISNPTVILALDKGQVAKGIGLTHFIDDNGDNCDSVAAATEGQCGVYLLSRPYNSQYNNPNVKRVQTLDHFIHEAQGPKYAGPIGISHVSLR